MLCECRTAAQDRGQRNGAQRAAAFAEETVLHIHDNDSGVYLRISLVEASRRLAI
jgi:hypothetical protein